MVELMTLPVISTAHLTKEVAERLSAEGDKNPWCPCASWEYGFFIFLGGVSDEDAKDLPQCLQDIRGWLIKQGDEEEPAGWLRLDSIAEEVEGLPTYDW